ncbi:MAG: hypothetical protein KGY80_11490 [Candidatus Thorarchaeota archaeon]|nr:hypothetical protein [Candidatus Thorarchaeota archaeon]
MENKKSFLLCLLGGLLLIITSATGSIGYFAMLEQLHTVPELQDIMWLVDILLNILTYVAGLGGIGVIIGGYLLTTERVGTGKFIVGLAAGTSLIGLLIDLGKMLYFVGLEIVIDFLLIIAQSIGWIGIILSIIGRQTASSPE